MGAPGPQFVTAPIHPARHSAARNLDYMRQTTAPVTVVAEVDSTNLQRLYEAAKAAAGRGGVPISYTALFARATVKALQALPIMNSVYTPRGYVIPRFINLGIATQAPGVVMIPAVANAESKSVPQLSAEIEALAQQARSGRIAPIDATFVITNTGRYGSTLFGTPTIKPPNTGILAFEAIKKRPVVTEGDRVEARPIMYLALTADHKAVDGGDMTTFVGKVKEILETCTF